MCECNWPTDCRCEYLQDEFYNNKSYKMGIPEEPRMSVKDTANWLFDSNFPISKYEVLQQYRRNRLRFWEKEGLKVIANEEIKLIEFGENVLTELKRLYLYGKLKA